MSRTEIHSNRSIITISNRDEFVAVSIEDLTTGLLTEVELNKDKAEKFIRALIKSKHKID